MNVIQQFLVKMLGEQAKILRPAKIGHEATRQKRERRAPCHNHGQGETKKRRQMAAASNRINRQRCPRWKF